jgi:hypothetical protein
MLKVGGLKYCYTHGFNYSHLGKDCTKPCETHVKAATVNNMRGGNDTIARRRGEKRIHVPPVYPNRNRRNQPTTDE